MDKTLQQVHDEYCKKFKRKELRTSEDFAKYIELSRLERQGVLKPYMPFEWPRLRTIGLFMFAYSLMAIVLMSFVKLNFSNEIQLDSFSIPFTSLVGGFLFIWLELKLNPNE